MPRKPLTYDRILTVRFRTKDVQKIERASTRAKLTPTEWIREQVQRLIGTYTEPETKTEHRAS